MQGKKLALHVDFKTIFTFISKSYIHIYYYNLITDKVNLDKIYLKYKNGTDGIHFY